MRAPSNRLDRLRARLKAPGPVIDVHVHPFPVKGLSNRGRTASLAETARALVAQADQAGIDRLVLMNIGRNWSYSPKPAELKVCNDEAAALRDLAPDRFVPFAYLNPAFPDESCAELERGVKSLGLHGVKLWVAVRASDPRVKVIAEKAVALDVPILQHVWNKAGGNLEGESTPDDLAVLARAVPHARLILGHLFGGGLRGIEAVADLPNVVVESGGSDPESGVIEAAVRRLGSKRVLFGSDAGGRSFGVSLGKVTGAEVSDLTKRRILWDNLVRILPARSGLKVENGEAPAPEDLAR